MKTETSLVKRYRYCGMSLLVNYKLSGMVTSGCLPVFADGSFQGVTCIDIPLDTLFSPIIDFHLSRLSYAFLIDSHGRVLLHPLLPKLETSKQEPIFLDMESVEISSETPAIKRMMIK